jgi:hypothetical protein
MPKLKYAICKFKEINGGYHYTHRELLKASSRRELEKIAHIRAATWHTNSKDYDTGAFWHNGEVVVGFVDIQPISEEDYKSALRWLDEIDVDTDYELPNEVMEKLSCPN